MFSDRGSVTVHRVLLFVKTASPTLFPPDFIDCGLDFLDIVAHTHGATSNSRISSLSAK